jgi:endonuclease YncB( thermonuclease family)
MWVLAIALVVTSLSHGSVAERDFHGVVSRVFDGDSFIVETQEKAIEVRLADIDAPEKDQPHADLSRNALIDLIDGRRVFVDVLEIDRYDRKVAKVYREPDRLEVARVLVKEGHVWVNRRYAKDAALIALENRARERKVGIWALASEDRIPPWKFRAIR